MVEPDPVDILELLDLGIPRQRVLRQMQPAHLPDLAEEVAAQPSLVELVEPFLGCAPAHPPAHHRPPGGWPILTVGETAGPGLVLAEAAVLDDPDLLPMTSSIVC